MDTTSKSLRILMLPWLAHGHISPFLELARALTKRNFYVYLCSTPVNLVRLKQNLSEKDSVFIKLVEFHLPSLPELPPKYHTTNGLPPHLMATLKEAMEFAQPMFKNLLIELKPDLVLYDFLQPWVPKLALELNIPAVLFLSSSAALFSYVYHFLLNPDSEFPFSGIYCRDHEMENLRNMTDATTNGIKDSERVLDCFQLSTNMVLIKTCREIEGKYIDYLSFLCKKKVVPVGALVQTPSVQEIDHDAKIMSWLNKKDQNSTVFASFGSEYFLTRQQIQEIALGLELSNLNFIWVIRVHMGDECEIEQTLPYGYLKRVGEKALVIQDWAPQGRILSHSSIGGFVSHCGWSSVMEGIKFGVPIIALPMHLDQPLNAKLVEEIGIGKEVERNKDGGDIESEELGKVIREVVVGEKWRRKVEELSAKMEDNGERDIDEVVKEIMKLCNKVERYKNLDIHAHNF